MEKILEIFGIDWRILIVQIVNFAILLGLMWRLLYRPLIGFIEKRREQIIEGVANAERAETALADAQAKKTGIITEATLESEGIIKAARETAKQKEAGILHEAQERSERAIKEAELKGEEIKREALRESKEEMARLVVLGVEKTLRAEAAK